MKYWNYFKYLIRHKWYVMLYCFRFGLYCRGLIHDLDKFLLSSFIPYAEYAWRLGSGVSLPEGLYMESNNTEFNAQWLKHRKNSKHHWQYWAYGTPREMDSNSILEMYCDWMGAMRCNGKGYKELKTWYAETRESRRLNERTLEIVDKLMQYKNEERRVKGNDIR